MRVTDKHVCFWNEWPSNWHPAEFDLEVNGVKCHFYNTEQKNIRDWYCFRKNCHPSKLCKGNSKVH